jgi:hypothetical protein
MPEAHPTHADFKDLQRQLGENSEKLTDKLGETNERMVEVSSNLKAVADRLDRQSTYQEKFHDSFELRIRTLENVVQKAENERAHDAEALKKVINDVGIQGTAIADMVAEVKLRKGQVQAITWVTVRFWLLVSGGVTFVLGVGVAIAKIWASLKTGV